VADHKNYDNDDVAAVPRCEAVVAADVVRERLFAPQFDVVQRLAFVLTPNQSMVERADNLYL